jgi:hypothetical protein
MILILILTLTQIEGWDKPTDVAFILTLILYQKYASCNTSHFTLDRHKHTKTSTPTQARHAKDKDLALKKVGTHAIPRETREKVGWVKT